jgi:chitinase
MMRIDFSNQPGYWDSVVDRPGGSDAERKSKRAKRDESGYQKNRKRWLEDEWRDAYHHGGIERHEIHRRWFGEDIINWLGQLIFVGEAEATKELNHKVNEKVELILIDQQFGPCPVGPAQAQANIRSTITAEIDVETSFGITIITTLTQGMDLSRSYLYFRNAGEVNAKFELDAVASLTYSTGDIKLLGLDDFPGATFRVPGVVTVGPNLAVYASADASLVLAGHLEADVTLASWEIQQTYPQNDEYPEQALDEPDREAKTIGKPSFDASITANGEIALHLKPTVSFGIDFDDRWKVPRCAVDLVLDGYVIGHAEAHYSHNGDNSCPFSYGIDAGSTMYAQLDAPDEFGWGDDLRVTLAEVPRKQITPSTCVGDSGDKDKRAWMGYEAINASTEDVSPHSRGLMPMPVSHGLAKRDTLTLGPLVTIPDSFLNCPGEGGGKNFCVMCSMFGKESSDNKGSKREIPPLFRRDEDDSCPYYPPGDDEKCTDSDSSLFARASDPNTAKKMTLSFLSTKNKFTYLRYPRCNAKNNGPSSVAKVGSHGNCVFLNEKGMLTSIQKWYLPEFMLSSSTDINDNRRCSAKTTKENSVQGANNVYYVDGNSDLPATAFRSEHVFEVHLVSHFLEWVCGGTKEAKYGNLRSKLAFPKDWKPADSTWCNEVFGGKKPRPMCSRLT